MTKGEDMKPGTRFVITVDAEYRSQNKRGGRPMVIAIPKGTEGIINHNGTPIFPALRRRGHMPFVWWCDYWRHLEQITTDAT
jgi:hypothetical protein